MANDLGWHEKAPQLPVAPSVHPMAMTVWGFLAGYQVDYCLTNSLDGFNGDLQLALAALFISACLQTIFDTVITIIRQGRL